MKIRLLAAAALVVVFGTTACGSEEPRTTASASGSAPTTVTTVAPTATTAATSPAVEDSESASVASAPTSAVSPTAPAVGQLTPSTMPAQTLTTLPSDSFTVTDRGVSYYCEPASYFDDDRNDCVRYYGGRAPYVGSPDLYCSRSYASSPECSEDWYPADLEDADMVMMGGQTYVCRRASLGGVGDKDCARYSGGDPDSVSYVLALKCSPELGSMQCDDKYYPSEWKGLTQVQIGYDDYICKSTFNGKECWEWSGYGSPKSVTFGMPDLYCNSSGTCDEDRYPSRY